MKTHTELILQLPGRVIAILPLKSLTDTLSDGSFFLVHDSCTITELEPYISNKVVKNAQIVYNQKIKNIDIGYIKNTVDFKLLEEKLKEWNKSNN